MERFKSEKGMSDEEFDGFLDRVYHLCNHVFMGELNDEVLGLLFKGLYYDRDLSCAEREAEVRGRNERIVFENGNVTAIRYLLTKRRQFRARCRSFACIRKPSPP